MVRPYSVDLRERVVRAVEVGASCRATAANFAVSVSFVVKLMQHWRRRGTSRRTGTELETLARCRRGRSGARAGRRDA